MAGLPKKYAKMGFKKGWRAYKATKRKSPTKKRGGGKVAKRMTTRRPAAKRAPTRRKAARRPARKSIRRRVASALPRISKRTVRATVNATTKVAIRTSIGIAGAAGSAALVNSFPMTAPAKAWSQLAIGLALSALTPKKNMNVKIVGFGAALVGGLAVLKQAGMPIPELLAGSGNAMGLNYYPGMRGRYGNRRMLPRPTATAPAAPVGPVMGLNVHNVGAGMSGGYGSKFITQADM